MCPPTNARVFKFVCANGYLLDSSCLFGWLGGMQRNNEKICWYFQDDIDWNDDKNWQRSNTMSREKGDFINIDEEDKVCIDSFY